MPTTLTLKNIPDALYVRLKETADAHRRSLNSEVIVCLESILLPQKISVDERLARARQIRQALPGVAFSAEEIAQFRGARWTPTSWLWLNRLVRVHRLKVAFQALAQRIRVFQR